MIIKVIESYRGRKTEERLVEPGVYELGDPRLFGCGKLLLELGKAVIVQEDVAPVPEPTKKRRTKRNVES